MFVTSAALTLFALLPALTNANPIEKRYSGAHIRSYRTNTCLTVQGSLANGAAVGVGPCSSATLWDINPGSGSVIVTGSNFALDAGTNPHNNVPAKIWTSYPGLTQQTWYLTGDNRIAITGGNQCLDEGDNGPQTYQCTTGNTNQIWYVDTSSTTTSASSTSSSTSTTSHSSTTTSSTTTSSASSSPTRPAGSVQIKWQTNPNLCATVDGTPANGTPVNARNCLNPSSPSASSQLFIANHNGVIQLAGTNFCLDAGTNPSNGVQMKVWQCYPGLAQQTWNFPAGSAGLVNTANNECLDIAKENLVTIQTWTCSSPDPQQQFVFQ